MTIAWRPAEDIPDDVLTDWQKEPDLCAALELASKEDYYAQYCGYDKLMLAALAEIRALRETS